MGPVGPVDRQGRGRAGQEQAGIPACRRRNAGGRSRDNRAAVCASARIRGRRALPSPRRLGQHGLRPPLPPTVATRFPHGTASMLVEVVAGLAAGALHVWSGPDHLAAVAPLAVRGRRRSWAVGMRWGIGHSAGVAAVALFLVWARDLVSPELLSEWGERLVGVMLVGIGLWGLRTAFRAHVHEHRHAHDGEVACAHPRPRARARARGRDAGAADHSAPRPGRRGTVAPAHARGDGRRHPARRRRQFALPRRAAGARLPDPRGRRWRTSPPTPSAPSPR